MRWYGGIVHLIVPVPLHYISEAEAQADLSHNPVDNTAVMILASMFVGFFVQTALFFCRASTLVSRLIVAPALLDGANGGQVDGNCVSSPSCRICEVLSSTKVSL